MEKNYISVSFPNLIAVAIMLGVIVGLFFGVRKIAGNKAAATA